MPRPTPAQFAYGSVTVICSALAMLLLSQTSSGPWLAAIAVAATALGVFVALTAPTLHLTRRTVAARRTPQQQQARVAEPANSAPSASVSQPLQVSRPAGSSRRMAEPSL